MEQAKEAKKSETLFIIRFYKLLTFEKKIIKKLKLIVPFISILNGKQRVYDSTFDGLFTHRVCTRLQSTCHTTSSKIYKFH